MCWWVVRVAVFTLKQSVHGNAGEEVWQLWRVMDEGSGDGTLLLFYSMVQPGWVGVSVGGSSRCFHIEIKEYVATQAKQ